MNKQNASVTTTPAFKRIANNSRHPAYAEAKKAEKSGWKSLSKTEKGTLNTYLSRDQPARIQMVGAKILRVANPVSMSTTVSSSGPRIAAIRNQPVITHQELLGTIFAHAGEDPSYRTWVLNPSNPATFNWIQPQSTGYDKYRITQAEIFYTGRCSTTTSGLVCLAYDPDASDANPVTAKDLENMAGFQSVSAHSCVSMRLTIPGGDHFIRDNSTSDPKLVDSGKILVAAYGQSTSEVGIALGEVRISYTLQLKNPQPHSTMIQRLLTATPLLIGPVYASVVRDASGTAPINTLTFTTTGRWFIVVVDSVSVAGPDSTTLSGFTDVSAEVSTGGTAAICLVTATSVSDLATMSITTGASGTTQIYVTRDSNA